jgi:hypothetical protein
LQRVICDFGSDHAFGTVNKKLKEHYGIRIPCVGDGARWIANQVEEKFGSNGAYLIDFYHLCEYLSAAAPYCTSGDKEVWLKAPKEALKLSEHFV